MVRVETLVIVYRDDEVLLGLKRKSEKGRGFGKGKWNGYGGGREDCDLSLENCVRRETRDEAGIELGELREIGFMHYTFDTNEEDHEVHIYTTDSFKGELVDSCEMYMHTWFGKDKLPYDEENGKNGCVMWDNDVHWMPYLLRGEKFKGRVFMDENYEAVSCVVNGKEFVE